MDLTAISVFVDVMRRGSFAAVAKDRNVDPSLISRSIAHLKDELGVRLFQRTTRRTVPTEAGRLYFEKVEPLVEQFEHARQAARDVSAVPSGNLRVTTSVVFGQMRVVPLLPEFRRTYPQVSIELLTTDAVFDLIAECIDVAIRLGPRLDVGYVGAKLFPTRYRVCASPEYVAREGAVESPVKLGERRCLLFDLPGFRERWLFRDADGATEEVRVAGDLVFSNALAVRQSALAGLGPALLANWMTDADLASGALIDLCPAHRVTATDFDTAAWILYPSRTYLPAKTRAFGDLNLSRIWPMFVHSCRPSNTPTQAPITQTTTLPTA